MFQEVAAKAIQQAQIVIYPFVLLQFLLFGLRQSGVPMLAQQCFNASLDGLGCSEDDNALFNLQVDRSFATEGGRQIVGDRVGRLQVCRHWITPSNSIILQCSLKMKGGV